MASPQPISIIPHPSADSAGGLLQQLWCGAGLAQEALDWVTVDGEAVLPSCFRVADVASASIAASGLAAALLWRQRTGIASGVNVDMAHAEIAYRSERYLRISKPLPDPFNPFWGYYQSADGRWIQLHTSFPHHLSGALSLLGLKRDATVEAVRHAVAQYQGQALEDAMAQRGLVGALMRSRDEWLMHPHGQAVQRSPLLEIIRVDDAPPSALADAQRPLSGVRVMDLTRVIAGPVCGRTLAEHGADVLRIQGPTIPFIPALVVDTGRGKRSAFLDLTATSDRQTFEQLLQSADVLVQGYRPGAIAGHGYGPQRAFAKRPGLVYVSICAYGYEGPWAERRGFDSLVQMVSGIAATAARMLGKDAPQPLPCQALDHTVGYLAAFATMAALSRRATEGGSWHVKLSLVRVSEWLQRLGVVDGLDRSEPAPELVESYLDSCDSEFGRTTYVRPVCQMQGAPAAHWQLPASPIGSSQPVWVERS